MEIPLLFISGGRDFSDALPICQGFEKVASAQDILTLINN
jgi:hypothetical protein